MTPKTKTYRGRTLEELLPKIREEVGPGAVITNQKEGLVGGVGGFFAKRCVEVEVRAPETPAVPTQKLFDAYDAAPVEATEEELRSPVIDAMLAQAEPFAQALEQAELAAPAEPAPAPVQELPEPGFRELDAPADELAALPGDGADFGAVRARLAELGMPEAAIEPVVREAERGMRPFDQDATPEQLVRRAFARQVRIEHGWKTKRRTIALVGAAGSGKTLAAAKLCHAYASGTRTSVRTISLEPAAAAYRLGSLTEHLDIGVRIAETAEAAARAAARMQGESLIVVDTPPVTARDADAIAALGELLAAVKPDEVHLVVPATADIRATIALFEALAPAVNVNRLLITQLDGTDSLAAAAGLSFALRKPISYLAEGRRPSAGLRPADAAELAELVLP
jgi:flagellar biosynthesis protein FlhF